MRKFILAALLAIASLNVNAMCQSNMTPDPCAGNPSRDTPRVVPQGDNACLYGVWAASQAYSLVVYDAKNPNPKALGDMLEFRVSQQPFPASEKHALGAAFYIAKRLRDAQIRAPQDWQVSWAADEYVKKECVK